MRSALIAAVTALVIAAAYTLLLAPSPSEPIPVEVDAALARRVAGLEQSLAAREAERTARLEGTADAARARCAALEAQIETLRARLEQAEPRLEALEDAEQARAAQTEGSAEKPATPADSEAKTKELQRWIERLTSDSENIRFSAALELGRLKDLRAVDALIKVLAEDRDYYVRLGAATALGDIRAVAAVPALIDALDDKDTLVRTAANDAVQVITGHTSEYRTDMSERDIQDVIGQWRDWWRDNESRLRAR